MLIYRGNPTPQFDGNFISPTQDIAQVTNDSHNNYISNKAMRIVFEIFLLFTTSFSH